MIITAICRSGGTKFAIDKSTETGLPFIGEIDQIAMSDFTRLNKNEHHEISGQADLSFSELIHVVENHDKYVILNNQANPALFSKSAYFLTRKDVEATFYSLATLIGRQYPSMTAIQARQPLMSHCFRIGLVHTYMRDRGIVPLYYEDLFPDVKTEYKIRSDASYVALVSECMNLLRKHNVL